MNQIDGILSDNLLLLCSVKFGYKQIINKFVQLVNVSTINHASTQCRLPLLSIRWKSLNVCMYVCLCLLCAFVYNPRKKKKKKEYLFRTNVNYMYIFLCFRLTLSFKNWKNRDDRAFFFFFHFYSLSPSLSNITLTVQTVN